MVKNAMMHTHLSAGKLPGSVLTRYDLLGTCVHGRLQHAY